MFKTKKQPTNDHQTLQPQSPPPEYATCYTNSRPYPETYVIPTTAVPQQRQRNVAQMDEDEDPFLLFRQVALTILIPAIVGLISFGVYSTFFVPPDSGGFIPISQVADFCTIGQFCRICFMCQISYFSIVSQISIVSVFSMISVGSFGGMCSLIGFYSIATGINLKVSSASVFKLTSLSDIFPTRRGKGDDRLNNSNNLA